jgi:hypothetical protein
VPLDSIVKANIEIDAEAELRARKAGITKSA